MPVHRTSNELDQLLHSLADTTSGVAASPGFSGRVISAISATSAFRWSAIVGAARAALTLAVVSAVMATVWAVDTENQSDEALAAAYGAPVKEW